MLLLTAVVQRGVHHACCSLILLWIRRVHLGIYSPCCTLLRRALSPTWFVRILGCALSTADVGVLTQWPLYVLAIGIHLIQNLSSAPTYSPTSRSELRNIVWPLNELLI